ncbi:GNAT family N-acetyltransferase [Streptomyces sp. JJ38]|uniref:GNAT family N-acetyltransferase n=1 Tax=Streptomyces sp. JJ38 TaxID=2738128 RepID=UPI001C581D33|nr:GNAT family N-acetyltransferase [Streptomyces sp. JJ38]MBW1596717.1 GNAT family N-acetyltransferase [Streptomyces sp. JJ38]
MTTTLRPTGAEERSADGGRSRTYAVCVNGRPVGRLRLAAEAVPRALGHLRDLTVEPAERRRGRATVAALAAEEILRGWGCRRVHCEIPAAAEAARRLAVALGYREGHRYLAKEPEASPPPPPGSAARPMSDADFLRWRPVERSDHARTWQEEGLSAAEAAERAERDYTALLPEGPATAGAVLRVLAHDGEDVGWLWLGLNRPGTRGGYLYTVRVAPEHRGRGHGRTLLHLAEDACLAAGAPLLTLNVRTANTVARGLYASCGFRPTRLHFGKELR